jgi:adenylate kinase
MKYIVIFSGPYILSPMEQIIFAGGIHGVGKSTLCRTIAEHLGLVHLSASELLKWKDLNVNDEENKKVRDIPDMQDRLLKGLATAVEPAGRYILDGHYCLFNKDGAVTPVPLDTFAGINPVALLLVAGDPVDIAFSLQQRDGRAYDYSSGSRTVAERGYRRAVQLA